MSRVARSLAVVAVVSLALARGASTTDFTFTKIADTNTPVPGGTGTFSLFADARTLDGDAVAFYAFDSASRAGIYIFQDGLLDILVDENTIIPGSSDTFTGFFDVSMENGIAVFTASGPGAAGMTCRQGSNLPRLAPIEGIEVLSVGRSGPGVTKDGLAGMEGVFAVHLASGRLIPVTTSQSAPFNYVHGVDLNGMRALFTGGREPVDLFHNHAEALAGATGPGELLLLVSPFTEVPGGGGRTFIGIDENVVLSGNSYAFSEIIENTIGAVAGIYKFLTDGGELRVVADSSTAIPNGTGTFKNFAGMDFDERYAAFMGRDSGNAGGLYAETTSGLRVVADRSTRVPGESFNFLGISNPIAHWGGNTAFSGYWPGGKGLCIEIDGVLEKVIEQGDILDGRAVDGAYTGVQQLNDRWMVVKVIFDDLSTVGLYRVQMTP